MTETAKVPDSERSLSSAHVERTQRVVETVDWLRMSMATRN